MPARQIRKHPKQRSHKSRSRSRTTTTNPFLFHRRSLALEAIRLYRKAQSSL